MRVKEGRSPHRLFTLESGGFAMAGSPRGTLIKRRQNGSAPVLWWTGETKRAEVKQQG